ncbi:iron-sulfur cluster biosynthesis family protein [Pontibacillus litoralis]|uniref:Core domain-containing protein n=1 Tax=Pontibacillus litoralis JSM 072002 TaxID=1385512 RepID=A0A0A5HR11_9BACI|nr:iron-sulfur cluster biosynthesis family protein [Pontibacillus litoralis]KGX86017.1 hypothetical protein N784_06375 [Pontibacillus litoralis JSM 072002]
MKLHITNEAKQQLQAIQPENLPLLRLYYDTDGCGCGVNGINTIHFTNHHTASDEEVENDTYQVFIDSEQKVFFEPSMTLAWNGKLFQLKSNQGMLNASISSSAIKKGGEMVE